MCFYSLILLLKLVMGIYNVILINLRLSRNPSDSWFHFLIGRFILVVCFLLID